MNLAAATTFAACLVAVTADDVRAADLPGGRYVGSVELGPVHLDGRYTLTIGENAPGALEVTTSPTGALAGRVLLFGAGTPVTGRIAANAKEVRLALKGRTEAGGVAIAARLVGDAFVGTAAFGGRKEPCRIDVGIAGPLRVAYDLTLTATESGAVTGSGTVTAGAAVLPAEVRGKARKGMVALSVRAAGTSLTLTQGRLAETAVRTTAWRAAAFGAAVKKATRRLVLTRD